MSGPVPPAPGPRGASRQRRSSRERVTLFFKTRPRLRAVALRTVAAWARWRLGRNDQATPALSVEPNAADWVGAHIGTGARAVSVTAEEIVTNQLPKNVRGWHDWEYEAALAGRIPPASVFVIPGGHVVGEYGSVIASDGRLLQDVSLPIGELRVHLWGVNGTIQSPPEMEELWHRPARRLEGTAAVLTAYYGRAYYHWLFDVLPRFGLIKESGFPIDEIDHYIVPGLSSDFQVDTLATLGISRKRVVSTLSHRHLQADRLIVPGLSRPTGFVPRWACEFLRGAFPGCPPPSEVGDKLYVVRRQTDHGLLAGEQRLVERLERHGFRPIAMEKYSLAEKAWILERAQAVISASGAGLANIVFCSPGAKIVELRARPYPVMEAWDIANRMGLDFYDVVSPRYHRANSRTVALDMGSIDSADIEATLEMAGCLD